MSLLHAILRNLAALRRMDHETRSEHRARLMFEVRRRSNQLLCRMNPLARDRYRLQKLTGPMGVWDELQRYQFDILVGLGLEPHHSVLDIGCGPITVGLELISYLDSGNYVGIDARSEPLVESYKRIARHGLAARNPRLIRSSTFGENELETRRFDYIWMSQLSYHLDDAQMTHLFAQVQARMSEKSAFVIDVLDPDTAVADASWRGLPYYTRPFEFYEALAKRHSLTLRRRGQIRDFGYPRHINLSANSVFEFRRSAEVSAQDPGQAGPHLVIDARRRAPRLAALG